MAMVEEASGKASWKLPLIAAFAVLCTAGPLVWSRDFGLFLLLFPYAFGLGVVCLVLLVVGLFAKGPVARSHLIEAACAPIAIFALLWLTATPVSNFLHDRVGFEVWYATNSNVAHQYGRQDAIIMTWDEWGMAGMDSFSFLISDPDDSIGRSTLRATAWTRRLKSECEVMEATRARRGLYILSTFNCPLTDERKHPAAVANPSSR